MLGLVVTLIVVGILLYVVNTYVPMDANVKKILNVVVILCVVLWLLNVFGVFAYLGNPSIPRLRN